MRTVSRRARYKSQAKSMLSVLRPQYIGPPSFIGGRNVDWAKDMATGPKEGGISPDQCSILTNFDIDESGILVGRRGTAKKNDTAINSGAQIHSMCRYYKASSQATYFMLQTGTDVGTVNLGTGAFTDKGNLTTTEPLKWITWNDMLYGFNGTGVYKFDGATWSQIQDTDAECPDSADGVVLDDILFTARDGDAYPSRVPYSDEFDAETWAAADYRRVEERDGHIIMSLMRLGNKILCVKDLSVYWLHGSSIYDFAEEKLSKDIGQVGRMANANYEDKCFFQSNRGIEYFDPNTPRMFNNVTRGTCANEITGYTRSQRDAAVMCYWPKKNRLLVSYPTISTSKIYVFYLQHPRVDEDGNVWFPHSVYEGFDVTAMCVVGAAGDEGKLYWGSEDGYIYEYDSGWDDDDTAIETQMEWGFHDGNMPVVVKNWSRAIIPAYCSGTLSIVLNVDFSKNTSSKSTPTYLPAGTAVWDSAVWDTDKWAEAAVVSRITRFNKMNGVKASLRISRSNSAQYELHPFKLEYYPKEFQRFP